MWEEEVDWTSNEACPHPILSSRVADEGASYFQRNRLWLRCTKGLRREEAATATRRLRFRLRFYSQPPSRQDGLPIPMGIYKDETFEVFGIFVTRRFVTAEIRRPTNACEDGFLTAYVNIAKHSRNYGLESWAEISHMADSSIAIPGCTLEAATTFAYVTNRRLRQRAGYQAWARQN